MKLAILTKSFPESLKDWGGNFVREQARALSSEHSLIVVKCKVNYGRFSPFFSYKITDNSYEGYKLLIIEVNRSFPVYNQLNFILSVYFALKKILKEEGADLIHCHYSYPAGVVASLMKLKYGIPFVVTEHTRILTTFRSYFHKSLSLWAMKRTFKVIAVSNSLKEELHDVGIGNVEVVPNVINANRFSIDHEAGDTFTVGFLGNLNRNKGLDLLIEACSVLNVSLKIGGEGVMEVTYKEMVKRIGMQDRVTFLGKINPDEAAHFYSGLDLFVLPSRYETFGVVLIEAMASGLPVIATRCGGPSEIVTPSTGILVEKENVLQLREAIENIRENYNRFNSSEIRQYAESSYGYRAFTENMIRIYVSALNDASV